MKLKWVLLHSVTVALLSSSAALAQAPSSVFREPLASATNSAAAAQPKPFTSFSALGSGAADDNFSACPSPVTCNGTCNDSVSIASMTVKASGLGKGSLSLCLNLDSSTSSSNGTGICLKASGPGTLTAANGSTVNIDFAGDFCTAGSGVNYTIEGGWNVSSGTGKLVSAAGSGDFSLTAADVGGAVTANFESDGIFRKSP